MIHGLEITWAFSKIWLKTSHRMWERARHQLLTRTARLTLNDPLALSSLSRPDHYSPTLALAETVPSSLALLTNQPSWSYLMTFWTRFRCKLRSRHLFSSSKTISCQWSKPCLFRETKASFLSIRISYNNSSNSSNNKYPYWICLLRLRRSLMRPWTFWLWSLTWWWSSRVRFRSISSWRSLRRNRASGKMVCRALSMKKRGRVAT